MKCPKCGSTLHSFDGCMVGCDNEKCYYRKHFTEYASTLETKKEKAEAELKAIKDRINGIAEIPTIENGVFVKDCRWNAGYNTGVSDCKEIIKQIGGVK